MKVERPWRRSSTKEFVQKATNVHGSKYDYSKVEYTFNDVKVEIICQIHESFFITPANHLSGQGCGKCGDANNGISQRKSTEKFIEEAHAVHGGVYDYSETSYITGKHKVKIKCLKHGIFEKLPVKHLFAAQGCPTCAKSGFKKDIPAILYVLVCDNLTKIGITNREVKDRVRTIKKSSGKNFAVRTTFKFDKGAYAQDIENCLLSELSKIYNNPENVFDGSTETFVDVNRVELLNKIESLIKEQNSSNNQAAQAA